MYALYEFKRSYDLHDALENGLYEDDYQDVSLYGVDSELVKTYQYYDEAIDDWQNYCDTVFEMNEDEVIVTYYVFGKYNDFDVFEVKEISEGEFYPCIGADY